MSDLPYHKAPASLANIGYDQWLHVDCSACKRPISGCCTDSTCDAKGAMCGIRAIAALASHSVPSPVSASDYDLVAERVEVLTDLLTAAKTAVEACHEMSPRAFPGAKDLAERIGEVLG